MAVAAILLCDVFGRVSNLSFFYTSGGVLPAADAIRYVTPGYWSVNFINDTPPYQAILFIIAAIANIALLLGYRTQVAALVSWVLLVSLHRRNWLVLQGGDHLIRVLMFWAMFLPLGARWSLDAVSSRSSDENVRISENGKECSVASALMLLQIAAVYLFAVCAKTGDAWRTDFTAIFYALNLRPYTTDLGRALLHYPELLSWLTRAVLAIEFLGPILAFVPFRNSGFRMAAVSIFFSFHLGLLLTMRLGPFPYVCLTQWLLFLPGSFWDRVLGSTGRNAVPEAATPAVHPHGGMFYKIQGAVLAIFFANVVMWNIRGLDFVRWRKYYPQEYNYFLEIVGLDQAWGMFSPYPYNWDGWYQIEGRTRTGRRINLLPWQKPDEPILETEPPVSDPIYPDERFRKYMVGLIEEANKGWRPNLVAALKLGWDRMHPQDTLVDINMIFWRRITTLNGTMPPERIELLHYVAE